MEAKAEVIMAGIAEAVMNGVWVSEDDNGVVSRAQIENEIYPLGLSEGDGHFCPTCGAYHEDPK